MGLRREIQAHVNSLRKRARKIRLHPQSDKDKEHRMESVREDRLSANPNCKIGIAKKYHSALPMNR